MRSREERFNWMAFSDTQKREILRLCRLRYQRLQRINKPESPADPEQPSLF